MTAFYDFFRYIKLYSTDGVTLEHTIEADAVTDSLSISRGTGVAWTGASSATDSFKIDVDYNFEVPVATTTLRLTDVNSNDQDIALVAGTNMNLVRDNANQLTISALVGGISKAIDNITQASPCNIETTNAHDFTEGTPVTITDVNGMTQLNGNEYYMDVLTSKIFALYSDPELVTPVDSTGFGAYTSGGVATGEYGGATKLNELTDVKAGAVDFTDSIMLGHTTTGTLSNAHSNIFIGKDTGKTVTSGNQNTVVGHKAGESILDGSNNTFIGSTAGDAVTTGSSNVIIGDYAGTSALADTVAIYTGGGTQRLTIDSTGATVNSNAVMLGGVVTSHLIPDTDITYDLGSSTHKFRDLYLDGTSIHLGSTILKDNGSGSLQVNMTNVLQVAADDSTLRIIDSGESIKFIGAGSVTTATDAEGNLTITGDYGGLTDNTNVDAVVAGDDGKILYYDYGTTSFKWKIYNDTNWDTAYGWGDHTVPGYLTGTGVLSSHTDVHNAVPTAGQVLMWDDGNSRWAPGTDFDTDLTGSVFGDDSTVLVDGVNNAINLDGTIKGHMIPAGNDIYDIGTAEFKIRDLYLGSNSLWVGDEHKITIDGGKKKFKKRKKGIVPAGVQTLLITSVFADVTALKIDFKVQIHDPVPATILDPDHVDFNPPTNKWQEFLALHGHPNKSAGDVYDNTSDFDDEGPDQLITEGDLLYHDGTDYKRLPIGSAAQVLLANGSGTAPEWGTVSAAIIVAEEGSDLTTSATKLDFVGSGVTASGTGATKTITIPGGGGGGGWTAIETQTVSSSVTSVTFGSLDLSAYSTVRLVISDLVHSNHQFTYLKLSNNGFTSNDTWSQNVMAMFDNTTTSYDRQANSTTFSDGEYLILTSHVVWFDPIIMSGWLDFDLTTTNVVANGQGVSRDDGEGVILWSGICDVTTFTDLKIEKFSGTFDSGTFKLLGMA